MSEDRASVRERYLAVDTTIVGDILDSLGYPDQGLSSEFDSVVGERLAGFAYTIIGQMAPYSGGGDPMKMKACEGVSSSEVAVWSGDGEGVCYFGELIALGMMERGCEGALVDGGVRDTRWLRLHGFSTFARYRTPIQSIGRWRVTAFQEPAYVAGATTSTVTVNPGDFILGDDDGALVIPADLVTTVLSDAEKMTETEAKVREALRTGMSLSECLEKFGHV